MLVLSEGQLWIPLEPTEAAQDIEKLSIASANGKAIIGAEEGDEIEFEQDNGLRCKALVESVDKRILARRHSVSVV